jgi:hypothetical protein
MTRIRLGRQSTGLANLLHGREALTSSDDLLVFESHLVPRGDRKSPWAGANRLVFTGRETDRPRAAPVGTLTQKWDEAEGKRFIEIRRNLFDFFVRAAKDDLIFGHACFALVHHQELPLASRAETALATGSP